MEITFLGWQRSTTLHQHRVHPWRQDTPYSRATSLPKGSPMHWSANNWVVGKIDGLGLSGSFKVTMKFERQDLESWIRSTIAADADYALRMLSAMHAEAAIAVATKERTPAVK